MKPGTVLRRERWWVCLVLCAIGVLSLGYGLIAHYLLATGAGLVLILTFGLAAAGARKVKVGTDRVTAEAEFNAPDPPPNPSGITYEPKGDDDP